NALKLKPSPDLKARLDEARFSMHRKQADQYIRKEHLSEAYQAILKALAIRKDAALDKLRQKLVEDISRKEQISKQNQSYEQYRAGAETQLAEGDLDNALTLFKLALDAATGPQQEEYIRGRIAFCESREAAKRADEEFHELFGQAEQAYKDKKLLEALPLYQKALPLKPGHIMAAQRLSEIRKATRPATLKDETGTSLVLIPEGTFSRGSESSPSADCKPAVKIFVSAFYLDAHEVTNSLYEQFDPDHERSTASPGDNMPVTNVSWERATAFCIWRTKQNAGTTYRLPTEAEWEKAARGGKGLSFAWGNTYDIAKGWVGLQGKTAVDVSSLSANPFGLHHMSGNVWEWCSDWYDKDYYSSAPARNPAGPDQGEFRIVRGGSFRFGEKSCRTCERNAEKPGQSAPDIGFRCVRLLPADTP
ncbi:SUMF1/EgtB/PvdO family nonheme iron enzyme, partial [Planctomycetota bacterium]